MALGNPAEYQAVYGNCGCTSASDHLCLIRQCTHFASWRIIHEGQQPVYDCWGTAYQWPASAQAHGFAVDTNPITPGGITIFCLAPYQQTAFSTGHVGVVLAVGPTTYGSVSVPAGKMWVEDYNWCNECCCYKQHMLATSPAKFIHIVPPASAPPPPPPPAPAPPASAPPPPPPPTTSTGSNLGLLLLGAGAVGAWYWAKQNGYTGRVARRPGTQGGFGDSTIQITHDKIGKPSPRKPGAFE